MPHTSDKFRYVRIRDVKAPTRGTSRSAGIDFYIPNDYHIVTIYPGQSANIPSGLKVRLPEGMALVMFNKSGRAVKDSLQVGACVIDEDYTGEVHLHVVNVGEGIVILEPGEKLVQGLILPIGFPEMVEESDEEACFRDLESERGDGGFGSTGLK